MPLEQETVEVLDRIVPENVLKSVDHFFGRNITKYPSAGIKCLGVIEIMRLVFVKTMESRADKEQANIIKLFTKKKKRINNLSFIKKLFQKMIFFF
jgi:hypothetical protein